MQKIVIDEEFKALLPALDRAELKEALRPCIDRLEELYRQIP